MEGVQVVHNCKLEIERVREQLIQVAEEYGMNAEGTIELSRKLDVLINEFNEKNEIKLP
ncbi:Spo0E family sporulation regulatory protein-aspartic acid phosphatase [Sporosarcina sp. P20a]|uniref:aspartyl-phosphate phosphatase Spo0E family protein n=1 Tax=unclassified Sporosarcina TaxID=2647733 RepID=UPI000C1694EE|nr:MULTISPECIES: aspartyl-phosphate phosphatase Spo0E family protein [unclassified Sporosarcina]PIC86559.1 Spo0E family sporulation regulatory protein-aspartic acid phosphatase [Sporosarcina sp. P20a]PID06702.1 Spo0E family sporulation regulatory protein-aspartic acid phosphatase [Sporosarcina sp. P30]PID09896.1 Spo0E family sporulation regulatory protein-aspartic acid phosphatase [Sporosarcina sp. P31]PID13474.1 Spo0E family sporulation regulatory protein-aspartic acid phosphatase [Sporosarcin